MKMKCLFNREKVLRVKGSPGKGPGNTAELTSSSQHLKTMSGVVVNVGIITVLATVVLSSRLSHSTHWY